jgi:hypothetical protein
VVLQGVGRLMNLSSDTSRIASNCPLTYKTKELVNVAAMDDKSTEQINYLHIMLIISTLGVFFDDL